MVGMTRTRKNLYISSAGDLNANILKIMELKNIYHYEDENGGNPLTSNNDTKKADIDKLESIFE